MSEEVTAKAGEATAADAGRENQPMGGSRTFTQDEVNGMLANERRSTKAKFADYDELKAKAAKYDEAAEAGKSELQKAVDEAAKWKAQYDELKERNDRAEAVAKAAEEHGVDAAMLARMAGDVEENALYLKEHSGASSVYDDGGMAYGAKPSTAKQFSKAVEAFL